MAGRVALQRYTAPNHVESHELIHRSEAERNAARQGHAVHEEHHKPHHEDKHHH